MRFLTGFGFPGEPVPVTTETPTTTTTTTTTGDQVPGGGRRKREETQEVVRRREARSVSSLTQREVECAGWAGDSRGYWRYQYQIPPRCYSKSKVRQEGSQETKRKK